jgi:N-acetylmuramoyl-L-alanine amidase
LLKSAGSGGQTGGFAGFVAIVLVLLASLFAAHPAYAQLESIDDYPDVIDARVTSTPQRARLIIDLSGPTEFAIVSLDKPNRIAIDVKAFELKILAPADVAGKGIVTSYTVEMGREGQGPHPADAGRAGAGAAGLCRSTPSPTSRRGWWSTSSRDAGRVRRQGRLRPRGAATPPGRAAGNSFDRSRHPCADHRTRPLVVIDPGHGGIDSGAEAPGGVHEKDIVLAFALSCRKCCRIRPLRRGADPRGRHLPALEERVALARQNKADIFISIHADSFQQPEIRGASVYTRDENATDVLDKVLAEEREQATTSSPASPCRRRPWRSGVDILVDLMRREMRKSVLHAGPSDRPPARTQRSAAPLSGAPGRFLRAAGARRALGAGRARLPVQRLPTSPICSSREWRRPTADATGARDCGYFDSTQKAAAAPQ